MAQPYLPRVDCRWRMRVFDEVYDATTNRTMMQRKPKPLWLLRWPRQAIGLKRKCEVSQ